VGAYLLYLSCRQAQLLLQGEVTKTGDAAICVVSGAAFAGVGAWVIWREWRAWRYAQAHKDDPETWGGAPETDALNAPELADGDEVSEADTGADAEEAVEGDETEETP
jgi:ABC-type nickel/cobalt efflux system permease component RcnA